MAKLELNRPAEALGALRRAIDLNPYSPSYYEGLARGYLAAGQRAEAEVTRESMRTLLEEEGGESSSRAVRVGLTSATLIAVAMLAPFVLRRRAVAPGRPAPDRTVARVASRKLSISEALVALGAWSIAIPFVAPAVGWAPRMALSVEIADHAIPGIAVMVAGAISARSLVSRSPSAARFLTYAPSVAFLAGLWMCRTHLPLILEAAEGATRWDTAIFHSTPGLPIVVLAVWLGVLVFGSEDDSSDSISSSSPPPRSEPALPR